MQQTENIVREQGEFVTDDKHPPRPHVDKLQWHDKIPLTLALMAQSYVVFIWYLQSTQGIHPYVDFIIALAAGIALDWLTVSTVMGRREGRTSIWSWLTSFGAFIGSATIAYDTYAIQWWPIDGKALLHVCYPLVVLLYSLHLAAPRQVSRQPHTVVTPQSMLSEKEQSPYLTAPEEQFVANDTQGAPVVVVKATGGSYSCPICDSPLASIGEMGAAKRWGHCRHCKGQAATPLSSRNTEHRNGTTPE
jgi:hypothetical protein